MFLHEWTPEFTLKDDLLRVLPIWVTFPQLPLIFWGEKSIGKIASALGKPMMTDECTAKKLRVSYARVLIEIDVTTELKNCITIRDPKGNKIQQRVEYEWKPPFCTKCNKVGHECKVNKQQTKKQPEQIKQVWTTKPDKNIVTPPPEITNDTSGIHGENAEARDKVNESVAAVTWTVVGSANKHKGKEIRVAETRVKANNADRIRNSFGNDWCYLDNYNHHPNGRIWLMWKTCKWNVKLLTCSDQFIHCEVYDVSGKLSHWMSVIYAQNQLANRKKLWLDIKNCANSIQGPWMVIGDFNNVLTVADRAGGIPVQPAEFYDLDCMMDEIGLYEHDTRGSHFTWSNKHTNGVIYTRIDRAICNREWFLKYPNCEVEVLNPHISDHSPLKLEYRNNRKANVCLVEKTQTAATYLTWTE
ncbi:hypothetical protein L195_g039987 [Trifolium pratense]|uniref:Uncharacterized protein n=1 Tax=Trifolium pratense TaxID=57577 RepID=A0A2K3LZH4_TRIPR|nr:hypothetical protein L195_g039987 [Trifolium pratense]